MVITMINLLKELCLINGVSGDEARVREYICKKISGKCDYQTDPLGNIIAFKKGRKTPAKKLMISAHMDEVGMIVTSIKADGTMTVAPVGGVDARVAAGRSIAVGDNGMPGVIGTKAVHNLSDDEKKKAPDFDRLYVDIGAENRDEAEKYVSLGDRVCFSSEFIEFGSGFVKCKAIDDRFGCAVMIKLIESELEYDCWFTFVVQEEVGLRGAKTAAYTVNPDFALVLEATTAADIPMAADEKKCCILGKGPVVSHMDRSTVYDKEMYLLSKKIAAENNISWQTKTMVAGGNDSGAIHITNSGVRTLAISVPCRYLHSPSCVIKMSDALESYKLAEKMITGICEL